MAFAKAVTNAEAEKATVVITLETLPPFSDNQRDCLVLQIVRYLKTQFETHMEPGKDTVLPAVAELAMYFGCSPLDVLDAFYELRRQGYAYCMDDLYRPVVFSDMLNTTPVEAVPQARKPFSTLAKFSDMLRQKFA